MRQAWESGINYVDVTPSYGESERRFGLAFRTFGGRPPGLFLSTKTSGHVTGDYSVAGTRRSVENSLRLLGQGAGGHRLPARAEVEGRLILPENVVHWFDVSRFLFGEPRTVYCRTRRSTDFGQVEDSAVVHLEFEGLTTVIQNAWGSYGYPATEAVVAIEGTEGSIFVDHTGAARLVRPDGGTEGADYDLSHYYPSSELHEVARDLV